MVILLNYWWLRCGGMKVSYYSVNNANGFSSIEFLMRRQCVVCGIDIDICITFGGLLIGWGSDTRLYSGRTQLSLQRPRRRTWNCHIFMTKLIRSTRCVRRKSSFLSFFSSLKPLADRYTMPEVSPLLQYGIELCVFHCVNQASEDFLLDQGEQRKT